MRRLWPYVLGLDAAALVVLGYSLVDLAPSDVFWGIVVAAVFTWAELYPLNISDDGDLTVGGSVQIAALLFFGLKAPAIGALIGEVAYSIAQRRPVIKTCFNSAQTVLCLAVSYAVFTGVGGRPGELSVHAVALTLAFIFANTLLVSWILSLSEHEPLWRSWVSLNRDTLAYSAILGVGGMAFAGLLLSYGLLGLALVVALVICLRTVLFQASSNLKSLKNQFVQTVRVLMTALEYRDPYTYGHSSRVAVWCGKIAREMGLDRDEIDRVELGGLLHDVGKVGVPDFVLGKPGRLTEDEFEKIRSHPLIGEKILLGMEGMEAAAAMAKQHHMRHDGSPRGYPPDLPENGTYIGSRILGVADAWDAMMSDRPYRGALSTDAAVAELLANKGTQFDPEVVDAFIAVLRREGVITDGYGGNESAAREGRGVSR
ncbi:MAG: HD domain-containing protein [Firmicutes bacterium]|jgi:putative nucleotidyltransferase with HDIG domain|nr:HD domain-containing protein [Bacillota bacterium]